MHICQDSIQRAEETMDNICERASHILYEKYLQPKVGPYERRLRVMSAIETTQQFYLPGQQPDSSIPDNNFVYSQTNDDGEPTAPPVELFTVSVV